MRPPLLSPCLCMVLTTSSTNGQEQPQTGMNFCSLPSFVALAKSFIAYLPPPSHSQNRNLVMVWKSWKIRGEETSGQFTSGTSFPVSIVLWVWQRHRGQNREDTREGVTTPRFRKSLQMFSQVMLELGVSSDSRVDDKSCGILQDSQLCLLSQRYSKWGCPPSSNLGACEECWVWG